MATTLFLDQQVQANPGDEFTFQATPGWFGTQYHFQVDGANPGVVIGIWQSNGIGKARNKPGQAYVDRTLTKDTYKITVTGATQPYLMVVTRNSWFKKTFGLTQEHYLAKQCE